VWSFPAFSLAYFVSDFSISPKHDLERVLDVKSTSVRGVFAIKVSGCIPERFSFARRFCPPQVVKGGAAFRMAKKQTATTEAAAAFHSHSRTNKVRLIYGRGEWT
jgi:hypothetical protein